MTTLDAPNPTKTGGKAASRKAARPLPGMGGMNTAGVDYGAPKGDPGMFGPDSVAWRVHANPIALAVGGIAAVILELAEPRVRSGVWDHSIFKTDPLKRMQRTGEATLITTYGPTKAAQARIDMVTRMHARVGGVTPEGQAYTALEPELMTWVHITAGWGFMNAYNRYVAPLSPTDQDRYYAEGARVGHAFGAVDVPGSVAEVDAWFARMRPRSAGLLYADHRRVPGHRLDHLAHRPGRPGAAAAGGAGLHRPAAGGPACRAEAAGEAGAAGRGERGPTPTGQGRRQVTAGRGAAGLCADGAGVAGVVLQYQSAWFEPRPAVALTMTKVWD